MEARSRRWARGLAAASLGTLLALGAASAGRSTSRTAAVPWPNPLTTCAKAANAFVVTDCYRANRFSDSKERFDQLAPSVVMLSDTPIDKPHYQLANFQQVGAIWGLAYSAGQNAVFAAAYHKRQLPFGPGGPGAIYRIDLASGAVTTFLTVPNVAADRHVNARNGLDLPSATWAGKTGLGGLEASDEAGQLWVMNLDDRRIYRFALSDGVLLGSFDNGAAAQPWAADARPFAVMVHGDRLYHGVVRSAESSQRKSELAAYVYESALDGHGLREVAVVPMDYARDGLRFSDICRAQMGWKPWHGGRLRPYPLGACTYVVQPEPMLTDLAFDTAGRLVLGLRDRTLDTGLRQMQVDSRGIFDESVSLGTGDIVVATEEDGRWVPESSPPFFYRDTARSFFADSSLGGLATLWASGELVSGAMGVPDSRTARGTTLEEGLLWYEARSGSQARHEQACQVESLQALAPRPLLGVSVALAHNGEGTTSPPRPPPMITSGPPNVMPPPGTPYAVQGPSGVGDVEALCAVPATATPWPTATHTETAVPTPTNSPPPSPTPSATPTDTPPPSATPRPTATRVPEAVYLPILPDDPDCRPGFFHSDIALVLDASSSMDELTSAGRSKIQAARESARTFLELLNVPGDQAALVAFNERAQLVHPLSGDRAALIAALGRITTANFTRIDLGVEVARQELLGAGHADGNGRTLVLLTDGYNNPEPASSAVAAAERAKAAGIRVFTVGLGRDVDTATLRAMASHPDDYFAAPDGEDLEDIYRRIAYAIPCPPERYWPYGRR